MVQINFPIKSSSITSVDYKRPIPPKSDMRTAYYFGHRLIYDNEIHSKTRRRIGETKMFPDKKPMLFDYNSETKASFRTKYPEPVKMMTSPSLEKVKGIKSYDEAYFKLPPKPIKQDITTYNMDYTEKKRSPEPIVCLDDSCQTAGIKKATYVVDPAQPNCGKYLDMMGTSYNIDYVPFSKEQLSTLAARDGVTLWNWNDIVKSDVYKEVHPAYIATNRQSKEYVPPRGSLKNRNIPSLVKYVPNKGMISETKQKYGHADEDLKFKIDFEKSVNLVEQVRFVQAKTEYSMYGSGDKIQRYI